MTQTQTFQNSTYKIECVFVDDNPWFRGKEVATVLGYANTTKAIINNVDGDDKKKMEELGCKFLRINPDAPDFKLSSCVGRIMREIVNGKRDVI